MREHDHARLLTEQIEDLDAEIRALIPDWQVPSLQRSYTESEVYGALLRLYDAA